MLIGCARVATIEQNFKTSPRSLHRSSMREDPQGPGGGAPSQVFGTRLDRLGLGSLLWMSLTLAMGLSFSIPQIWSTLKNVRLMMLALIVTIVVAARCV
jgi:hypothetical protein